MKIGGQRAASLLRLLQRRLKAAWPAITLAAIITGCGDKTGGDEPPPNTGDAAAYLGCPGSTPQFAIGLSAASEQGRITAAVVEASPSPPRKYLNVWTLELAGPGSPLADVHITSIRTFMTLHGHDGTPPPVIEQLSQPGRFHADLQFTMRGPWEVQIHASSPSAGDDYIVFNVCVEE